MDAAGAPRSAYAVAIAFINQYYQILSHSPQLLHGFYKEGSKLSRLDHRGEMISVTGIDAINEKLLSVDYSEYTAEIKMVDAQESVDGCVIVLVTGHLTGKDDVKKKFAQAFFLATQDNGYYILNDMFRLAPEQVEQQEQQENEVPEEEKLDEAETIDPSSGISWSAKEEVQAGKEIDEISKSLHAVTLNPSYSTTLEESQPSESYASIIFPVTIGDRHAFIERNKSRNSRASDRGRGRYRNQGIRWWRSHGAARGVYGIGEDSSCTDFGRGGGYRSV